MEGESTAAGKQKSCSNYNVAAAVFLHQNNHCPVLAGPWKHCLSSSPDLRIISKPQPSQINPMAVFRLGASLHAYSGGTVRESHPILYSPGMLSPQPGHLNCIEFYTVTIAPSHQIVNNIFIYHCAFVNYVVR